MSSNIEGQRPGKRALWKTRLKWAGVWAIVSLILFTTFYSFDVITAPPNAGGTPFFGLPFLHDVKDAPVNTAGTPLTMDALIGAYVDNPAQADQLFADKTYYVTGVPLSLQQNASTGQYYSDFELTGLIQFYWKDLSQASKVIPCPDGTCSPILAECFLVGFAVKSGGDQVIMFNNCEFIHS